MERWHPGKFLVLEGSEVAMADGWLYAGLAMEQIGPTWSLVHIRTGARMCMISGSDEEAFSVADRIVELGNWESTGPTTMMRYAWLYLRLRLRGRIS
jgi:hypothetical protein